jgi:FkbM family methyltransferase
MLISWNDVTGLYAKHSKWPPNGLPLLLKVAHVGAHYAEELDDYLTHGMQEIVLFEPLQVNCQVIREKLARLPEWHKHKATLHEVALGNPHPDLVNRWVPIHISSNEAQSSSLLRPTHHKVQYPSITFDSAAWVQIAALDEYKLTPDLLAMDTQGYELEVLKGATQTLRSVKVVYTEVSNTPLYEGSALVEDLDSFLDPFGFKRVRTDWVGGTWGDAVYVKVS